MKKGKEQDFETFVRMTLALLQESVTTIKTSQDRIMSELNLIKDRDSLEDEKLSDILQNQASLPF